jgi:4-amino-4-deoxy-L-arabinose transferase-like glycosyltransferase
VVLAVGHLLSTTTTDLLAWTTLGWLLVRALRDGGRVWLAVGAVAGVALENKTLPVFLLAAVVAGVLVAGPRQALATPWPWVAGLVAAALWAPNVVWQAAHGFPQLELSRAIAAGGSGTSEPAALFWPMQLLLVSPLLVPVWAAGWWRLLRDPALRTWRAFAVAFVLLGVLFPLTGGKPYYLAGLYPLLLAAGAEPTLRWAARGRAALRRGVLAVALALSLAVSAVLFLPLVPVGRLADTPMVAVNYDAGETVGWPAFAATVARVRAELPAGEQVVVLTRNYGEAGAVDRYLPELSPAYSGHNGYGAWGPPPESADTAVVVGYEPEELGRWFGSVRLAARVDNGVGLDDDEQGAPVVVATARRVSWAELWPEVRHLG